MKLFKNKKVTIMGLGLHGGGVGVAKFFCRQGAKVLVTDLKIKEQLKESISKLRGFKVNYVLGNHRQEDFIKTNLVIRNPGVPKESYFLKIAKEHNVPIETDITIFFKLCKAPIIGITGTKGKSTVATLIYELIKTKYKNAVLAGNIGISPLEFLRKIKKGPKGYPWVVLELSSFELENLKKSPEIAVITSIYPDHLDRYKNLEEYLEAKKIIFKYQKKKNILILNYDNETTRKFSSEAPSQVYFYSREKKLKNSICFIEKENIFFDKEKEPVANLNNVKLQGWHNILNVLAAISIAKVLKVDSKKIRRVLFNFKGVANRQDFVREVNGVKYFNDTTATMPEAVIAAIDFFSGKFPESRLILIAGGQNKNLEYKDLAKKILKKIDFLLLLPGTASEKIKELVGGNGKKTRITPVASMEEAIKKSSEIAESGDIVLLSPGAASFNLFKNEFDRGDQFVKYVKELKP